MLQVKEGEGFSPLSVDKFYWFSDDLFDLTRMKAEYHSQYHDDLIAAMRLIKDKYKFIVGENPSLSVDYYYVTKKDVTPNEDCDKAAKKVVEVVMKHFPGAQVNFNFANATALWKQVQKRPPKTKKLAWAFQSLSTPEGQIGLVRLPDYYAFVTESDGQLAERFFDSNVRGYWKTSPINKQIAATLKTPAAPE